MTALKLKLRPNVIWIVLAILQPHNVWAGGWTLPQGEFWSKFTLMTLSTSEEYVGVGGAGRKPDEGIIYQAGDRARYREEGEYDSRAVFLDIFYGVTNRLNVGVQVPFFRQKFENVGFRPANTSSGFSDIRGFLKFNLAMKPLVTTIKLGFKAPTGEFVVVDGLIPVGEGQWDFDFIGQFGRSFWPLPIYTNLDIGYRLRLNNNKISRDPGNEWLFNAELGYNPTDAIFLALKLDGIRGNPSTTLGLTLPSDVKRATYLAPTVAIKALKSLHMEGAMRFSLNGRNFPAGNMFVVGLVYTGKLIESP